MVRGMRGSPGGSLLAERGKFSSLTPDHSVVFQLQGKSDARFTEVAFRVLRDYLGIKPVITPAQFLEQVWTQHRFHVQLTCLTYLARREVCFTRASRWKGKSYSFWRLPRHASKSMTSSCSKNDWYCPLPPDSTARLP